MKSIVVFFILLASTTAIASQEYLIKFKTDAGINSFAANFGPEVAMKNLNLANWVKVTLNEQQLAMIESHPNVIAVEKNITLKLQANIEVHDPIIRQQIKEQMAFNALVAGPEGEDNPDFPTQASGGTGSDPNFNDQWGMKDIGVKEAWASSGTKGNKDIVVAVIDTGVDYTHEDLVDNMWRNPGESGVDADGNDKATNGIDDDNNGYVDDLMGWDFAVNDNKPYDLHKSGFQVLLGGNPGHGTHCAGNVAATADNGKGIVGVAPGVKIMAMRFLTEEGQGTLEGGINSIKYAVDNGAQILSNSWGSEGDGGDQQASQALQDAIQYAQDRGVLFVAAAGNGHQGVGYDNDIDDRPAYPASYPQDIIVSVAALDDSDNLGSFSNWGRNTVDIGAPGVRVMSTVPDNEYQDTVINIPPIIVATWDGTSMATPHVSGAAALYMSKHPNADWREVKDALIQSATPINALQGKSVSNGKLNVKALMDL